MACKHTLRALISAYFITSVAARDRSHSLATPRLRLGEAPTEAIVTTRLGVPLADICIRRRGAQSDRTAIGKSRVIAAGFAVRLR